MGTRALDDDRWFVVDDEWELQRSHARALLTRRRADVVGGSESTAAAALDSEITAWLRARDLDASAVEDADPLVVARSRVADDLCLLLPSDDAWTLAAGAVCFPSLWRLREKIDRPLSEVHDPVPGYAGGLASRVDGFLGRLSAGRAVWRRNWSIHADDALFVPDHVRHGALPPPEARWLRSERQTLRRLCDVDAVAFTIRTQQVPIATLASRPEACASLAAAVKAWSPAQRAYKGDAVDDALLHWLDAV
ncbi:MAG: hypothetical protein QOD30_1719 [Actinomycetota bacterium]|nr:hypothetical protein [Actinomycetota bacterium]